MSTPMYVIRPVTITESILTSSTVTEPATGTDPDPAAWNGATAYAVGDRVHYATTHKIYQRVVAGTTATAPDLDSTNWLEVSATNRWKMFDSSRESQTTKADSIVVVLTPGVFADALALLNLGAASARVQVTGTSYDETQELAIRVVNDWWDYFYEPFEYKQDVVFDGLPMALDNEITITVANTGSTAGIGVCVLGLSREIGVVEYGASVGITDYSIKSTDAFGQTTIVERAWSKRMNLTVWVDDTNVDANQRLLASYRAKPLVWVGVGNLYESLIVYGYFKSFDQVIAYPTKSKMALDIEGLA
jgi:hypothetical protein